MEFPEDLKYVDSHEYLRVKGSAVTVGITAYAVDQLGDIVFVELPEEGSEFKQGDKLGTVESVKAVEDLIAPVSGRVTSINTEVVDEPSAIGDDPYGDGWLVKIELSDNEELDELLTSEEYREQIGD
ncbi:MAG: glycine cleavage system protein GcvH [Gloeobacterales cyanobacterium]